MKDLDIHTGNLTIMELHFLLSLHRKERKLKDIRLKYTRARYLNKKKSCTYNFQFWVHVLGQPFAVKLLEKCVLHDTVKQLLTNAFFSFFLRTLAHKSSHSPGCAWIVLGKRTVRLKSSIDSFVRQFGEPPTISSFLHHIIIGIVPLSKLWILDNLKCLKNPDNNMIVRPKFI